MANVKITALEHLSSTQVAPEDVFVIDHVGPLITKKITLSNVTKYLTTLTGNAKIVESNLSSFASYANANAAALSLAISNISANFSIAGDTGSDVVVVGAETLTFRGRNGVNTAVGANELIVSMSNTGVAPGSYGGMDGTTIKVPTITIDTQGRITLAQNTNVVVDFSGIQANVNTVQSNVYTTQTNINTVQTNVYAVQSSINLVQSNVNVVQSNVNLVQSNVATAGGNINTVQGNVTTLTTSVNTIKANVDSVQGNVTTLTTSVNTIKANVDSVAGNVTNIINGTTAFTGNITMNRDLTVSGNLVVGGATSTILTTDTIIKDRVITLSNGAAAASFDTGLYLNRGTSGNVFVGFDESAKQFVAAYTNDLAGNTVTDFSIASYANVRFNTITADGLINNVNIANLPTNINTVQSNLTTLTTSVNTIKANVDSVQSNVATAVTNINTVQGNVTTLTTSVNTIKANVDSVQSNVATAVTNINTVQGNVTTLTTSVNTIKANVDSVQSNVGTLTTSVNTIKANVDSVQSNVATAVTSINTVQSNVTTLTTSVNTIKANVDSVQGNVTTLTTSVNTIKANVDSVQSNVASITSGSTAFTGNISAPRIILNTQLQIGSNTTSSVGAGATTVFTFPGATYRGVDLTLLVQDVTNSQYQLSKMLIVHNGTVVDFTEYAMLSTNNSDLTGFTAAIDAGANVTVVSTGGSANKKITVSAQYIIQ